MENLESIKNEIAAIRRDIEILKTDYEHDKKSNYHVSPGIACKIAFDAEGHVIKGESLNTTDLPDIPIGKVIGLDQALHDINNRINNLITDMKLTDKALMSACYTGTKINYNENGKVISSSSLLPSDIPELPMSKITGLNEAITNVNGNNSNSSANLEDIINDVIKLTDKVNSLTMVNNYMELIISMSQQINVLKDNMSRVENELEILRNNIKENK